VAKQTITIRLDEDDLTYLSSMELAGAANLSEKIRALLAEARAQREGMQNPGLAYDLSRRLFAGPERGVRAAEMEAQMRSELIARLLSWLPDITAALVSGAAVLSAAGEARGRDEQLKRLERTLGERAMSLVDSMLQMSAAGFPGCYEPEALKQRSQSAIGAIALHLSRDIQEKE
jgi:hypothetical protein